MSADTSAPAEVVQAVAAGEAVNALDWADVYAAARKRTLRDMTGQFYEEHLAREVAERLSKSIAQALNTRPVASTLDPETVEACARALVDKLDLIGPDPGGAFTMLHIRGMGYTGPTYAKELEALRCALSPGKTGSAGVGEGTP